MAKLVLLIAAALLTAGLLAACAALPGSQSTPGPTPEVDRLAEPPMPEKPSQADKGHYVYYQVCMACHGDFGQGLTDEWRAVWEEDSNCWQSDCHGNDHPPQGFALVRTCCKAVIGKTTLQRFQNGQELFDYVSSAMPWWNPGYLKTEEFWQVTNYLMVANGAIPDGITLDAGNAFVFNLHPTSPPPQDTDWQVALVCVLLSAAAGLLYVQMRSGRS
jgi:hypothetical protein